jgi:hypothetical protein
MEPAIVAGETKGLVKSQVAAKTPDSYQGIALAIPLFLRNQRPLEGLGTISANLRQDSQGLPMIWPGAVDICRPMMVRYSVIYGVTR